MGFIALLLFISLGIAYIIYLTGYKRIETTLWAFIICIIFCFVILFGILAESFSSTVKMQYKLVNIEQFSQTIKSYTEYGIVEFQNNKTGEITDLKYQNYQTQIGKMIIDLRDQITQYNAKLIGKEVMNKHWFWSVCIIPPPKDSVILNMSDYIN